MCIFSVGEGSVPLGGTAAAGARLGCARAGPAAGPTCVHKL